MQKVSFTIVNYYWAYFYSIWNKILMICAKIYFQVCSQMSSFILIYILTFYKEKSKIVRFLFLIYYEFVYLFRYCSLSKRTNTFSSPMIAVTFFKKSTCYSFRYDHIYWLMYTFWKSQFCIQHRQDVDLNRIINHRVLSSN